MTAAQRYDAIVLGAGAAGLMCAAVAGQRGLRVLLLDHAARVAEKIRISGGGRCNFTNRLLDARAPQQHYVGTNPRFARSALARYTPQDFIVLVERHGIAWHEKHKGQLFCDGSAQAIIDLLLAECARGRVEHLQPCQIRKVSFDAAHGSYLLDTERGPAEAPSLVVATGGLSIPKIGATDLGHRLARQFGLPVTALRPGLVPLTFDAQQWASYAQLAGVSLPVRIACGEKKQRMAFDEDLLFTHRGLSGPAVLQISSYWHAGQALHIDLAPGVDLAQELLQAKAQSKKHIANLLAQWLPARLADAWCAQEPAWQRPVNEASDKALLQLAAQLADWRITPSGTEGWRKAEVTLGGVDVQALQQQDMQARGQPGLYFIGEVVDVTGWLGGYNFQWAWASALACAQALPKTV
ncbi:NAD(P)/FAD-dependent oxidoreductase [Comamonas faecalis]|uniref:NAD(P)/FAD-dependent oxidoreductase n=1 Tax=Comamonas faecalis TaxID=1387849 RepID=A0ABP7R8M7_9BURK